MRTLLVVSWLLSVCPWAWAASGTAVHPQTAGEDTQISGSNPVLELNDTDTGARDLELTNNNDLFSIADTTNSQPLFQITPNNAPRFPTLSTGIVTLTSDSQMQSGLTLPGA